MAIYNAKYIADMNKADPDGSDPKNEGDNAIREIKDVLQTTFPNFEAGVAITATATQINSLVDSALPRGTIVMWAGDQGAFPNGPPGWTICDGRPRKSGGGTAPDLRGRFVIGAKPAGDSTVFLPIAGSTGGNNETILKDLGGILIEFETNGHALTAQQLPQHEHYFAVNNESNIPGGNQIPGSNQYVSTSGDGTRPYQLKPTQVVGEPNSGKTGKPINALGQAHTHKFTIETTGTGSNIPAYYAALYIIKD